MQNIFFFLTNYDGCVKNGLKHITNNVLYNATNITKRPCSLDLVSKWLVRLWKPADANTESGTMI
jgi:hypothetical protein